MTTLINVGPDRHAWCRRTRLRCSRGWAPSLRSAENPSITREAARGSHLSLWAVSGAPPLAGNKTATMSAGIRAVLTNRDGRELHRHRAGPRGGAAGLTGADKPGGGTNIGSIVGKQSGRCLDIDNSSTTNGAQAQLWDCNGQDNQRWTYTTGRQLTVYGGGKCLDALNGGIAAGTKVVIWACNGQADQQWHVGGDGTIRAVQSGLCLDAAGAQTGNGTEANLWTCGTGDNQRWSLR
jgi:hypothetical protein